MRKLSQNFRRSLRKNPNSYEQLRTTIEKERKDNNLIFMNKVLLYAYEILSRPRVRIPTSPPLRTKGLRFTPQPLCHFCSSPVECLKKYRGPGQSPFPRPHNLSPSSKLPFLPRLFLWYLTLDQLTGNNRCRRSFTSIHPIT